MRLTQALRKQHIGQWFKKLWYHRRNINVQNMKSNVPLEAKGVEIVDAFKFIYPELPNHIKVYEIKRAISVPKKEVEIIDETHPLWNSRICHIYGDTNVLITGMPQAQVLTKTVCVDGLPEKLQAAIDAIEFSRETDKNAKNAVLNALLLDAEQQKLEKLKDPSRPAWVFPRVYGITRQRRNRLIVAKILDECEKLAGQATQRKRVNDVLCVVPFEKDGILYQFENTAETLVTSKKPLSAIAEPSLHVFTELPDIFPLKCNISIPAGNLYKPRNIYPISTGSRYFHPHTVFLHFAQEVRNLTETPVTQTQFESRTLLKTFSVAAASAQSKYGADVKQLPEPIVVQAVQTTGSTFHFGIFQLNTLDLDGSDGLKNVWYSVPEKKLYEHLDYDEARPHLVEYNPDVLRHALGFLKNQ